MPAATCSAFATVRPDTATRAPCAARARLVAAPMPWPAPVTMETRPCSFIGVAGRSSSVHRLGGGALEELAEQVALQQLGGGTRECDLSPPQDVGGRGDRERARRELV